MPGIISPDASEIAKAVSGDDFDLRKVRLFAENMFQNSVIVRKNWRNSF